MALIGFSKPGAWHENPRFHRVVFNDWGTSRPWFFPPMADESKPPAPRVVGDSKKLLLTYGAQMQ